MNLLSSMSDWPWPVLLLWLGALVWAGAPFTFFLFRRLRKGGSIFRPHFDDAIFTETWTSGRSCRGFARFGGAAGCLWVTVQPSQLLVGAHFPFSVVADTYRLAHTLNAADVISIEKRKPRFGRARALVIFRTASPPGEESFELILRDLEGFFAAMQVMQSNSR